MLRGWLHRLACATLAAQLCLLAHFLGVRRWVVSHQLYTASACVPDALGGDAPTPAGAAGERFLVYSPQFGHSNQLVAVRNAAAWAAVLDRTLVLPHLLGHVAEAAYTSLAPGQEMPDRPSARFGAAFDVVAARAGVAPLRVIEMDEFLELGLGSANLLDLESVSALRLVTVRDDYFHLLGVPRGHWGPRLGVPMRSFSPRAIDEAFGGCAHHPVLAFRSLFSAFDPRPGASPDGEAAAAVWRLQSLPSNPLRWLDGQVLPALLQPAPAVRRMLDTIETALTASRRSGSHRAKEPRALACVHVRRGDFERDCPRYEAEARSKDGREWVKSHFAKGWSCLQDDRTLTANIAALRRVHRQPLAVYASVEDEMVALRRAHASTLADWRHLLNAAPLGLPAQIADTLIDQMLCARARFLLLNVFSTFSQMIMGLAGVRAGRRVGFVRDLTVSQQLELGVNVTFWRQLERL